MDKLEVIKEVIEALDVVKEAPYPLYALLNRGNPEFYAEEGIKLALDVLNEWADNPRITPEEEELALRYIVGEDTIKVKPVQFKLLKGATITLGTGQIVTLTENLTVEGNIKD